MKKRVVQIICLITLFVCGAIPMIHEVEGSAPTTIRYALIHADDSGTTFLHDLETLFYALQPLDVYNETDVTYNDLFTGANSPKYNLIYWDRGLSINNGDLKTWLDWSYNNGSSLLFFYDGLEDIGSTLQDNFVTGAISGTTTIQHEGWINITSNPFISSQDFQFDAKTDGTLTFCYYAPARLQAGVTAFSYPNDATKIIGFYVEESGSHGRAVYWGFPVHSNNPILPLRFGAEGILHKNNERLTYEFVELFIESVYWCADAPVVKTLPTFSTRYDDFFPVSTQAKLDQFSEWFDYMKIKGIPLSIAHPTRNKDGLSPPDPQPRSAVRTQWRNVFTNSQMLISSMSELVFGHIDDGWMEWTTHGWTHEGNVTGTNNEFTETYEYDNSSGDPNFAIKVWLNESMVELEEGATSLGYSFSRSAINVLTISGNSIWGNKSAYAFYELGGEYVVAPFWSGWNFPNGTGTTGTNGQYVVDEENIGVWLVMVGDNTDDPSSAEITNENRLQWNSAKWFGIPSNMYSHALSWSDAEWNADVPLEYIDMIEDTIESDSWTRVLWIEDQGDYDKGFKDTTWTSFSMTWDGTTVSITDNVGADYLVRVPTDKYVSSVTVDNVDWFVFSDTEVYVPSSATSVSITTTTQAIDTPHIDRVRRASRGVTASSYDGNTMTFTVDGIPQLYAEIQVDTGGRGEPVSVEGVKDWSYDPSGFLTLTVEFGSSRDVSINWRGGAIGTWTFGIRVHVSSGMFPWLGAYVVMNGENKLTDILGDAYFEVPYGSYDVLVFCGDENMTRQIFVSGDMSVGFDFEKSETRDRTIFIIIGLPIGLIILVFVGIFLWRKK
ncbi:hypothetical protein ES702_06786 [subsurface metagenome]